jgi:hypothetical protein
MALSAEQKNDLRKRVLAGERLDPATAREIIESIRMGRRSAAAAAAAGGGKKGKGKASKPVMSDEALDADLDALIAKAKQ